MAGISRAERERRAKAKIDAVFDGDPSRPIGVTVAEWTPEAKARVEAFKADLGRFGNIQVLDPGIDFNYLTALCAALPFSGTTKAWEPLTFADRLEAAKVNAELILRAVGERNG